MTKIIRSGTQKRAYPNVKEVTERLYSKSTVSRNHHIAAGKPNIKKLPNTDKEDVDVDVVVARLCKMSKAVPDSRRVGSAGKYGVVNTYAWRGWNTEVPHIYWRYNYPQGYLRTAE